MSWNMGKGFLWMMDFRCLRDFYIGIKNLGTKAKSMILIENIVIDELIKAANLTIIIYASNIKIIRFFDL